MVNRVLNNDEKISQLISVLASNPRLSIKEISEKTGLSYYYVWRKINTLVSKKLITFSLMLSTNLVGKEIGIVRFKGNDVDQVIDPVSRCSKIILGFRVNSNEVLLIIHGRDKREIMSLVELLKSRINDVTEVLIEYGVLPEKSMIPIKNELRNCEPPRSCERCWLGSVNSSPMFLFE